MMLVIHTIRVTFHILLEGESVALSCIIVACANVRHMARHTLRKRCLRALQMQVVHTLKAAHDLTLHSAVCD